MADAEISVALVGLTQLRAGMDRLSPAARDHLRPFMADFTIQLRQQVKDNIAWRFRSQGPLYDSVQSEMIEDRDQITGRVFTVGVVYAGIQEWGGQTSAHEILPVFAKALAFRIPGKLGFSGGPSTNPLVFAKRVMHPGSNIPERSYARLALVQMRRPFEGGIREVVAAAERDAFAAMA